MREVSKIIVRIDGFAEPTQLMSVKRARSASKNKKLELLGGGTDGDGAFDGLVRELEEEEETGRLAEIVRKRAPTPCTFFVYGSPHHVFEVTIDFDDYVTLRHSKDESFGFKAVPESRLRDPGFHDRLTPKTLMLLGMVELLEG